MQTITVSTFEELQSALYLSTGHTLYRGAENANHDLVPRLWRMIGPGTEPELAVSLEKGLFTMFKKRAVAFVRREPASVWEWLALAQHLTFCLVHGFRKKSV